MTVLEDIVTVSAADADEVSHWVHRRAAIGLRIEKAALTLFLEYGPDRVSVDQIAAAAGISRRSFFRYFQTRDDILAAMPARQMVSASRLVCERPQGESLVQAILATSRNLRFSSPEEEIIELCRQVMVRFPAVWGRAVGELRRTMDKIYQAMITHRFQLQGRNTSTVGVIAAGLTAIVVYTYTAWVENGCRGDFADQLEQSLRAFSAIGLPDGGTS